MQSKKCPVPATGPSVPPCKAIVPPYRLSVPLTGAFVKCPIVGHTAGCNCIGARGACKSTSLGKNLRHIGNCCVRVCVEVSV